MHDLVQALLNSDEKVALRQLVSVFRRLQQPYLLRNEILQAFGEYCRSSEKPAYFFHASALGTLIHYTHEIILEEENVWFVVRPRIAYQEVWLLANEMTCFEQMSAQDLLDVRDRLVNRYQPQLLEVNFRPFYAGDPHLDDPRKIGQGLAFLNHHLCDEMASNPEYWLELLYKGFHRIRYNGVQLLIGDRIRSGREFAEQVTQAINFLRDRPDNEPFANFRFDLQSLGLEPGWGNTAGRVRETLELFNRLMESAESAVLEAFVARVPAIFRVVLVSVHGWVGQSGVLGRPETAGQVMYVLEQARALEAKLREEVKLAGLDSLDIHPQVVILTRLIPNCEGTACGLRLEKLQGTENGWILRVPFVDQQGQIVQDWVSKFEIWPYLENFALEAEREILAQLRGKPDLIVGNYSDGNLVAYLLSKRLKTLHCQIAHSLEKPKYLFSNLYWQDLEEQYHFSAQFTADLIGMNGADFIITSSYQEIVGTPDTIGQYESYQCFTMPQLYHVVDGIDLFHPKFNYVPPGINETVFFPYSSPERDLELRDRVREMLFTSTDSSIRGHLTNPEKRPLLAVAPINTIKNLTGLAECFGQSPELQARCNLILLTSKLHPEQATHPEEAGEIAKLHEIIDRYDLENSIRWVGMRIPTMELGEAYRIIADREGVFVHFARFEAFGRTLIEAMISGLPTFATKFGGASEVIDDENFHLNPTDLEGTAAKIRQFLDDCDTNPEYWLKISNHQIERVRSHYSWEVHTKQLSLLAKIYRFWDFVKRETAQGYAQGARQGLWRYLDTLYHFVYKPRAAMIQTTKTTHVE